MPVVMENVRTITQKAGAAISKYRFVKSDGAGGVIQSAAEGDQTVGIALDAASGAGVRIPIALPGCRVAIEAGAAIAAGASVETDAVGRAVTLGGATARGLGFVEEAAGGAGAIVTLVYSPNIAVV